MKGVLLDTSAWSWSLLQSFRLSQKARAALDEADARYLSAASFYEVDQKVRLGKWPTMAVIAPNLIGFASTQGLRVIDLDADVCTRAGGLEWTNRDPFDRMLAATALIYGVPIISSDQAFDGIVTRIW